MKRLKLLEQALDSMRPWYRNLLKHNLRNPKHDYHYQFMVAVEALLAGATREEVEAMLEALFEEQV